MYSPESLCVIPVDAVKYFQNKKIKIKILHMKMKGKAKGLTSVCFGAIGKSVVNSPKCNNFIACLTLNKNKVFSYKNDSKVFGAYTGISKPFNEQSTISIIFVNNTMKITVGKGTVEFNIPNDEEYFFFFNLQGDCKIDLSVSAKWR